MNTELASSQHRLGTWPPGYSWLVYFARLYAESILHDSAPICVKGVFHRRYPAVGIGMPIKQLRCLPNERKKAPPAAAKCVYTRSSTRSAVTLSQRHLAEHRASADEGRRAALHALLSLLAYAEPWRPEVPVSHLATNAQRERVADALNNAVRA
eukprot:6199928-Pleurochrysis_carterae.AAC.2